MGCGTSRNAPLEKISFNPEYVEITKVWDRAWETVPAKKGTKIKVKDLVIKRSSWKTVRIFVSSTFKDFHQEREVLIKKVFPDLRLWCEAQRIRLVECDLRWGVPKDINTEGTMRACLGEIDRCYQDNIMPFFINMTSERVGWVPAGSDVPEAVADEYKWVEGLSVTEMEIMHGAYRIDNPNALFMLRDPSFLEGVPDEYKKAFVDSNPIAEHKLGILKRMIHERFPAHRILYYNVHYQGYNPDNKMVELGGLEDTFSKRVFEFFKERISSQYPLPDMSVLDPYQIIKDQHESFMKNRSASVFGRDAMITQITDHIHGAAEDVPLLVVGEAGTGKSTIMARVAEETVTKALNGQIPGAGDGKWHVFYHFVGAVPGSTELDIMLKRLLIEMGTCNESNMPTSLENAAQTVCGTLTNTNTRPTIIIIDALNQFDDDTVSHLVSWVPRKLAPRVRCVFSMIANTPQYEAFMRREPLPKVLVVSPLDYATRKLMVTEMLAYYNKRLDPEQMESLLCKSSSCNPLWLSIAVEELRVFGMFRQILDKINRLANGLLELEIQILERFEKESSQVLLVSTLCLMEVSARGLLETELLAILGDEDHLVMRDGDKDDSTEKDDTKREKTIKDIENLPAFKWAEVYRNLKPFLRPFGDSGEGRLDFYHRSLSKAVRRKYFKDENGEKRPEVYKWWHCKLADFFETCPHLERKLEELPYHLQAIGDYSRLERLLTDFKVFNILYHEEYSTKLITYWRTSVGFERMEECYMTTVNNYANDETHSTDDISRIYEKVSRFMGQAGRFDKAEQLLNHARVLELTVLGARPERMVEIYHLSATTQDEVMKMEEYMYRSQLPRIRTIIDDFEKSVAIRRTLEGEVHLKSLGRVLNRLAFYYSSYNMRGGDEWLSAEGAKEKASAAVEEAISIFRGLNDEVHLADSLTTRGVTQGRASSVQLKAYKEAQEIFLRTVGEVHHLLDRLYLNMAIYFEEIGDYYGAFDHFYKWYEVCRELYGKEHPRCGRCFNTLREPMYRRIAQEKGIPIASKEGDD